MQLLFYDYLKYVQNRKIVIEDAEPLRCDAFHPPILHR